MASSVIPTNLLVVSSRAPQMTQATSSVNQKTTIYRYNYENSTLDDILVGIHQKLQGRKVTAIAMMLHSLETELFLCFSGGRTVSEATAASDSAVRNFFMHLTQSHLAPTRGRLDFLNSCLASQCAETVRNHLEKLLQVSVGIWKDHFGDGTDVGQIYFNVEALQNKLKEIATSEEKLEGYEKVKTVGKGAFGTAILYRHTETDNLVVIKEINMMELTVNERQMALNEAKVLSVLNHPNIVSYHRSFERDGVLMIEMEYADGGTLAQFLSRQSRRIPERDILAMFSEITAAIRHMHQHNILHRDLKTANVFLTKENTIKVGDFGISKAMTTRAQAQTVLGTPYYISPEMCEGKQYDQKSDIWALGCILYEMACLRKPFQGSSLPALVNNIMKGNFQPIEQQYSSGLRQMVAQILQREPHSRPTAAHLLDVSVPQALQLLQLHMANDQHDSFSSIGRSTSKQRSVLYQQTGFGSSFSLSPLPLPPQIMIKQVAVSNTHFIVLTTELTVLTWGEGTRGQLGQGDTPAWRSTPTLVPSLGDRSVRMVAAGDGFSVFVSDSGMLMTCGDGSFGCLGHSDWNNLSKPKLIEKLLQVDVSAISCGPRHVAVLAADCEMYTWGQGDGGRLGLGHERDICTPTLVTLPERIVLRSVHCGIDGTMAVSANGSLLACGRNTNNKLGLSKFTLTEKFFNFRRVVNVTRPIADVSLGTNHTCLLTQHGQVITMGKNTEGQLGHSIKKQFSGPSKVSKLDDIAITSVVAGPTYSAAQSLENVIFIWGTIDNKKTIRRGSMSSSNASVIINASNLKQPQQLIIKQPAELLALYASPQQRSKGNQLTIGGMFPLPSSMLILIHTTVPLVKKSLSSSTNGSNIVPFDANDECDTDSLGPVPDWIKAEVADSEAPWAGFTSTTTALGYS